MLKSLVFIFLFSFSATVQAADLKLADLLFQEGQYAKALPEYEKVFSSQAGASKWRAAYRIVESLTLLNKPLAAAERSLKLSLPNEAEWKAKFLLERAEVLRLVLKFYGNKIPEEAEKDSKDLSRKTSEFWHEEIRKAYQELWTLRGALLKTDLKSQSYFVQLEERDLEAIPTYWDLVVQSWSTYLRQETQMGRPSSLEPKPLSSEILESAVTSQFKRSLTFTDPPLLQNLTLLETASAPGVKGRETAAELWKIARLQSAVDLAGSEAVSKSLRSKAVQTAKSWIPIFKSERALGQVSFIAADYQNMDEHFSDAVAICDHAVSAWLNTLGGRKCRDLSQEIKAPVLNLTGNAAGLDGKGVVQLEARNLDQVWLRAYALPKDQVDAVDPKSQDWNHLRSLNEERIQAFLKDKPIVEWTAQTQPKEKYFRVKVEGSFPAAQPGGIYAVIASSSPTFEVGKSLTLGALVNVSSYFLIGSSGVQSSSKAYFSNTQPKEFSAHRLFLLDAQTGSPVAGGKVQSFTQFNDEPRIKLQQETDSSGKADIHQTPSAMDGSFRLDALAVKDGQYALLKNISSSYMGLPNRFEFTIETDRPVYRPGQKVQFKGSVIERTPGGYRLYTGKTPVTFTAMNPNGQEVFSKTFTVNEFGSFASEFSLPQGQILGRYRLFVSLQELPLGFRSAAASANSPQNFSYDYFVQVEEYKRPEFEIQIQDAKEGWVYGQAVQVEGSARYYFGSAVPQAAVHYRVFQESFMPWFMRGWGKIAPGSERVEVAQGDLTTDAEGRFGFKFTPSANQNSTSRFVVEIDARDSGGRTLQASKSFLAGDQKAYFESKPEARFWYEGEIHSMAVRALDLEGRPIAGTAYYSLYKLGPAELEKGAITSPSLEELFSKQKKGERVHEGQVSVSIGKPAQVQLPKLSAGFYRWVVSSSAESPAKNEDPGTLIAVVDPSNPGSQGLPIVTLLQKDQYSVGDKATVLLGAKEARGQLVVEVWAGQFLISQQVHKTSGIRRIEIPVTEDLLGGFLVRWFTVSDRKVFSGQASAEVPWENQELRLTMAHPSAVTPGETLKWTLNVEDRNQSPVSKGELSFRVFDRSLEYYAKDEMDSLKERFYSQNSSRFLNSFNFPQDEFYSTRLAYDASWGEELLGNFRRQITIPIAPSLRFSKEMHFMGMDSRGGVMEMASSAGLQGKVARAMPKAGIQYDAARPSGVRKDFSETAVFLPQVPVRNGQAEVSFKMPEQLTSWKLSASGVSPSFQWGSFSSQFQTQKEFMLRSELPRFVRKGDQFKGMVHVHNQSQEPLRGELKIQTTPGDEITHVISVEPGKIQDIQWATQVPATDEGPEALKIKVQATCGKFSDGEEREIPIFPAEMQVVDSQFAMLEGKATKVLKSPPFEKVQRRTVQVDPQLALSVLESLPYLSNYPHEYTDAVVYQFVPAAIMQSLFDKNPALVQAVNKIPNRTGADANSWDKDDPRRIVRLMETPWELGMDSGTQSADLIQMLSPERMEKEKARTFKILSARQRPSGGFPWYEGGEENLFTTLKVLEGFAEAAQYEVEIPAELVNRAVQYVLKEIPKTLNESEKSLAELLFAGYVISSFKDSSAGVPAERAKVIRQWISVAEKRESLLTPYGKALLAYTYWNLEDRERAGPMLQKAMDGSEEDPVTGVYWAPEKISWYWYNDSIDKHAFFIQALLRIHPTDPRRTGMLKWLLFNRKGNAWASPRASAGAVFALIEFLQTGEANPSSDQFQIKWGEDAANSFSVSSTDWLSKPLRWTKEGKDLKPAHSSVEIKKEGSGLAFASLTTLAKVGSSSAQPAGEGKIIQMERRFLKKAGQTWSPFGAQETLKPGDLIEVQLRITSKAPLEFVHVRDPKPAGFELESLTSGWSSKPLWHYMELKDSLTNFYIENLPQGEVILSYRVRATTAGIYRAAPAVVQSVYAPEFGGYSGGVQVRIQ